MFMGWNAKSQLLTNSPLLRPPFNVVFTGFFFFFALQPINMNQCGLNIEEGEGENVIVCYNI